MAEGEMYIKMEIDTDEEEDIEVVRRYNIQEEDKIFDTNDDPLLSLDPVVYTTKLDDMNTFKQDLKNLRSDEILRKLHSESIIRTKPINRLSSNTPNVESFIKLFSNISKINSKANAGKTVNMATPQISGAYFNTNKQDGILGIKNKEIVSSDTTDKECKLEPEIATSAVLSSDSCVNITKISLNSESSDVITDKNSKRVEVKHQTSTFTRAATAPNLHVYFRTNNDTEIIQNTDNIESFNNTDSSENYNNFTMEPPTSTNATMQSNFDVDSSTDVDAGKEYLPCYVVLPDIKKFIGANKTVKIDSNDRIVNEINIKKEPTDKIEVDVVGYVPSKSIISRQINIKEEPTDETEVDVEVYVPSKSIISQQIDLIENENSFSDSNVPVKNNEANTSHKKRKKRNAKATEVVSADQLQSNDNKTTTVKRTRKRNSRIIYETSASSSDDDYVPTKKTKSNKIFSNMVSNSVSKIDNDRISNVASHNTKSSNSTSNIVTNVNTASYRVKNINTSSNVSNSIGVVIVANDITHSISFQEKYALIVLTDKNKKSFVYRVNSTKLITDYYVTQDCDEYKLASMYPKEEKIIEPYCCWYQREEIVSKICSRKNYSYTIQKFLKQPHTCQAEECQCCCHAIKTDSSHSNQHEKRTVINKSLIEAENWIRKLLNTRSSATGLVSKALAYTPKIATEKPKEKQSEKYLDDYLLCLKNSSRNLEYELYEIGQNGIILSSVILNKQEEVAQYRKKYQLLKMPIRDAVLCCWFKREKLMYELKTLKTSPSTLKYLQKPHTCNHQKCSCCCKPLPVTLRAVETLPLTFKHITAYEKKICSLSVHFNAKSKNVMWKVSDTYEKSKKVVKSTEASTAAVVLSGYASKDDNPDLSISILRNFKNLKLAVNGCGELEAVLNEPAKTFSVAELKILSEILELSSKQVVDLGLSAEEFCNRINSKSENVIRVLAPETPLISTEQTAPPVQDQYSNEDSEVIAVENEHENINDSLSRLPKQTALTGETGITSPNLNSQNRPFDSRKTVHFKPTNIRSVSNMFTSLSNLMDTKNKNYVESFKSFFNKSEPSNIMLSNVSPMSNPVRGVQCIPVEEVLPSMPIITETFTLSGPHSKVRVAIPGPSGIATQPREANIHAAVEASKSDTMELQNSKAIVAKPHHSNRRKLENAATNQVEKKIRVKLPSELNAPIIQATQQPTSGNSLISGWPAPIVIKREPQTNIQQIVRHVSTAAKLTTNAPKQTYVVTNNVAVAPSMKIVSPTHLTLNKVFRMNGNPVKPSATASNASVRYLTIAPLQGSNSVDTGKNIAKILTTQQAQPATSSNAVVPPLVPIRPTTTEAILMPVTVTSKLNTNRDVEASISYNVISNKRKIL